MERVFWNRMADELTPLHVAAVREHFRRIAIWAEHLDRELHWMVPQVEAIPGLRFNQKYIEHWLRHLEGGSRPTLMKRYIHQFIYWRAIMNPDVLPAGLPDLFAPFQLFCSIGGWMNWDHSGVINLNQGCISKSPIAFYLDKPPYLTDLVESTILVASILPGRIPDSHGSAI